MSAETTSPQASSPLLKSLETRIQEGEVVFHEGDDTNRDLFLLLEGAVEVCKGIFRLAEIRGPNAFLGEVSTLLKIPRTATLVAKEPCRLYRIPEEKVEPFFKNRPALALQLAVVLAERLEQMNRKCQELLTAPHEEPEPPAPAGPPSTSTEEMNADELLRVTGLASFSVSESGVVLTGIEAPDLTYLNGRSVSEPTKLAGGDKVQLGRYLFQFFDRHPDLIDTGPIQTAAETKAALEGTFDGSAASPPTTELPAEMVPVRPGMALPAPEAPLDPAIGERLHALSGKGLPAALRDLVGRRLELMGEVEALDEIRREIARAQGAPPEVESELARQNRELARPPGLEPSKEVFTRLQTKIVEGKRKAEEGAADAPHAQLLKAWALGYRQAQLLIDRESLTPAVLEAAGAAAVEEPLYQALERLGAVPRLLFGLTIHALGVEEEIAGAEERLAAIARDREEAPKRAGGILGLGKNRPEDKEQDERWRTDEAAARSRISQARRELEWLEPGLVEEFWRLYEFAASALVAGRLQPGEEPFVRAYLRWGLLGSSGAFLDPAKTWRIVEECARPLGQWTDSTAADHVLYADEYVVAASKGWVTPSMDEDLELNQRMSPLWKADRAWRRIIHSRAQESSYRELADDLQGRSADWRRRQAEAESALAALDRTDPASKRREHELKDALQEAKVEAARLERAAERIRTDFLAQAVEGRSSSGERLQEAGVALSQTAIARQEVAGIRRVCRLVAKLKEAYLPLALRTGWFPERDQVHDRVSVLAALADAERRDPLLFRDPVFPADKKQHRILLRQPPVVLVVPAAGAMGFAWNPRYGTETGRLVLPGIAPRGRMLEGMLWELLSDFRYDTSKASAGVDFLKSDTLAAAYASVRWEYRRKGKEVREKAAIYLDEKERANFRRHYVIHMKSALDGGKLLFFKCAEVYEALLRYLDLPEGIEKLKK